MNAGCAGKTVRSLENAHAIPERIRGVFTTMRYTNPYLPLPIYLYIIVSRAHPDTKGFVLY